MLKSIRNISLLLSLVVFAFGSGTLVGIGSVVDTAEAQKKQMYELSRQYTENNIILSCLSNNFAVLEKYLITCAVMTPNTSKQKPAKPAEKPKTLEWKV